MSAPDVFACVLELATLPVALRVEGVRGAARRRLFEERFGPYRARDGATPVLSVLVEASPDAPTEQPPGAPWPGAAASESADGRVVFVRGGLRVEHAPAAGRARAVATPVGDPDAPATDFSAADTALRLVLSYELPRRGGLLVHASGYGDARGAVIFPAVSGGGKTTTALKLPSANVLSDDQVAIVLRDGRWFACALPFVGMFDRATTPRAVPLRAVAFLEKAAALASHPLAPAHALAQLVACAPMYLRTAASAAAVMTQAWQVVHAVRCARLALALTDPVMPEVERWLAT